MTRKLEIHATAFPGGVEGAECSANLDITVPESCDWRSAQALAVAVSTVLAHAWKIAPETVRVTAAVVTVSRQVEHYGDVQMSEPPRRG